MIFPLTFKKNIFQQFFSSLIEIQMRLHILVGPSVTEQLTKECDGRVTAAAAMLALLKQTASPVLIMPQAFVMNSRLRILNFCLYWNTLYAKMRRNPILHSLEFRCASVLLQMSENGNNASDINSNKPTPLMTHNRPDLPKL